jgi:threonine/homoserine/homoserine lactone efflux protein
MSHWEWLTLASLCLAGAASPGPSLAVILGAGLNGGRSAGLASAWAHALGVGLYATLTVFGISALVTRQEWLFMAVQSAGALYLLWLAKGLFRTGSAPPAENIQNDSVTGALRDGFAIAFLNPKLAVFMLALFSQFVRPDAGLLTSAKLIATATLVDGLWYSLVTLVLIRGKWIALLRENAGSINRLFAILLSTVALIILFRVVAALVR